MSIVKHRKALVFGCGFIALCTFLAFLGEFKFIIYNPSESVPKGFYRYVGEEFKEGDIILFPVPEIVKEYATSNYSTEPMRYFLKPVLALEDDHICYENAQFKRNGELFADVRLKDSKNKPLPLWNECRDLEENEVFVFSDRVDNSFDSRYYGTIKKDQILGVFKPLWIYRKDI